MRKATIQYEQADSAAAGTLKADHPLRKAFGPIEESGQPQLAEPPEDVAEEAEVEDGPPVLDSVAAALESATETPTEEAQADSADQAAEGEGSDARSPEPPAESPLKAILAKYGGDTPLRSGAALKAVREAKAEELGAHKPAIDRVLEVVESNFDFDPTGRPILKEEAARQRLGTYQPAGEPDEAQVRSEVVAEARKALLAEDEDPENVEQILKVQKPFLETVVADRVQKARTDARGQEQQKLTQVAERIWKFNKANPQYEGVLPEVDQIYSAFPPEMMATVYDYLPLEVLAPLVHSQKTLPDALKEAYDAGRNAKATEATPVTAGAPGKSGAGSPRGGNVSPEETIKQRIVSADRGIIPIDKAFGGRK